MSEIINSKPLPRFRGAEGHGRARQQASYEQNIKIIQRFVEQIMKVRDLSK